MSRIGGNPVLSPVDSLYVLGGRILGGSGVASISAGKGFSLTYVSTGVYKVTTDVNYPSIIGGAASVMSSTHPAYTVTVSAYVQGGAGTSVTFTVASAGSATDLGASEELWFTLDVCRSVKP